MDRARERETVQVNSAGERSPSKERSWFLYRTPGAHLEGSWCPIALGTGACDSQRAGLQDTHDYVPSTGGSGILSCVFVSPARTGVYARWNFAHGNFAQRVALALLVPRNSPARPPRFLGYGTISAGSGQGTQAPVYLLKRIRRDPRV